MLCCIQTTTTAAVATIGNTAITTTINAKIQSVFNKTTQTVPMTGIDYILELKQYNAQQTIYSTHQHISLKTKQN